MPGVGTTTKPQAKLTLEQAEHKIKLFLARCYFGSEGEESAAREANRDLIFSPNYAYESGGPMLSLIVFQLKGSPPKGTLCAVACGFNYSQEADESLMFSPLYVGKASSIIRMEDYIEVSNAIDQFVKLAMIPINGVTPITSKNANRAISAFTKLERI